MKSQQLNLKFKGARIYLHGSDIFNAIEDLLSEIHEGFLSKLVFKTFARNQIEVLMAKPSDEAQILGQGNWKSIAGDSLNFWLRETDILVAESYAFDEDLILTNTTVTNEQINLEKQNIYSTIENVIALTKKLNYVLTPNVNGKWLFGQIDLQVKLPETWRVLGVVRTICVANSFSRNRILIDGEDVGEIRFIGGVP